jgi:hypothetical protein
MVIIKKGKRRPLAQRQGGCGLLWGPDGKWTEGPFHLAPPWPSSWSMDGCSESKHRGWAGQVMDGNGEDVQISNGGGGVIEGGGWPHGWRSPHLGGLVTGGSGQLTHADEWRDGHGRCIVGAGATSSWTPSREVILYWLCRSAVGGGVVQGMWRGSGGVQGIWLDPQQPGLLILPVHLFLCRICFAPFRSSLSRLHHHRLQQQQQVSSC